jgi:chromo domain-containing protein 1
MPLQEKQAAGSESRRRFDMIPDDTSVSLQNFLSSLPGKFSGRALPLKIYPFPVAYWDETTASELNVHPDDFKMYSDCIRQFKEQVAPRAYNTIVALFYTVEGKLSHGGALEDARKKRRPWIVVYRPMNLHMRYYDEAELIIWDPVGKKSCRDYAEVYEGDLADAQRTMIQQLREERDMMPLKRIWIGGWDTDQSSSIDPLDRTLQHLETLMHDWKNSVPIPVLAMRDQGWRTVERGHAPPRSRHPSPEPMDLDATAEASDTADEDLKIVFHPPRGRQPNRPTNCRNRFFQHCIHEEIRGRPKNAMEYRFEPTMEWYRHQVEEGRGFQHINFMPWEEVFAKYKIEDPKKKVRVT